MDAGQAVPPEWLYCGDAPYAGGTVLELAYRIVLAGSAMAGLARRSGQYRLAIGSSSAGNRLITSTPVSVTTTSSSIRAAE